MAGGFLEGVEEIDAEFGGLRLELEEAGAGECAVAAGLFGSEAHDAAAAAGEHAEI